MKVWLVFACGEHYDNGSTVLRVCKSEEAADRFKARCEAADKRRPEPPEKIVNTRENDKLHEDWWARRCAWYEKHPAKGHECPSLGYSVRGWKVQ